MWFDIPSWVKFLLVFIILGAGSWVAFKVSGSLGFIIIMVGVAVLLVSGTDPSDKRGYKF